MNENKTDYEIDGIIDHILDNAPVVAYIVGKHSVPQAEKLIMIVTDAKKHFQ